jgi:serine/threonine protein kinase
MADTRIADRYDVVRSLGRGSFAQTYLAYDTTTDRQVAIKVLHPRAATDWKSYELFEREAAVLRELRHRAIPAVYEAFRAPWDGADAAFLVMEYIDGASLAEIIAEKRHLDSTEVVLLFVEMLGVLDYLHSRVPPILHRDIKPANLIVRSDGSPALVDFGAVRNVFRGPDEGGSTVVGTYGYMPYEQYMGRATPSSDLYALAATFLHLLTGRAPAEFMTEDGALAVPSTLPCSDQFARVLGKLLSSPTERYRSARDARAALLGGVADERSNAIVRQPIPSQALPIPAPLAEPVPRPFTSDMQELLKKVAYSPAALLSPKQKSPEWTAGGLAVVVLLGIATAGVLPAIFFGIHRSRKKRIQRFLTLGTPATARIRDMTPEKTAFEQYLTRVRYEFEADGQVRRDSDLVLPSISDRWDPGALIQVLYIADDGYDSVIISVR